MDKTWIRLPRHTSEYIAGVEQFLDFALAHSADKKNIRCPCIKCNNKKWQNRAGAFTHLISTSFPVGYTEWYRHGETPPDLQPTSPIVRDEPIIEVNPLHQFLNDAFGRFEQDTEQGTGEHNEVRETPVIEEVPRLEHQDTEFARLMKEGEVPLYDGSKIFTKLSFILQLYYIKSLHKISDTAMSKILDLLRKAFDFAKIPKTDYEAKRDIKALGLDYIKIDACHNDCMLYTGFDVNRTTCTVCKRSRYLETKKVGGVEKKKQKPIPEKVFRYFPLIPRLKRLFASAHSAESMVWHATEKTSDELIRHPRDSDAWKFFDNAHPDFANEPRNIRLGLATDGFNPFGVQSSSHSTWPVILIPYNTPPWLCMKQTGLILSSIIPGKKQPGNDIDIYLQPLIEELLTLWGGVQTYDAAKKENFIMQASLMWTISDFPGLGTLSGWNTYSKYACPCCNVDAIPHRLEHSGKYAFTGSRRFLPSDHRMRGWKNRFNGKNENRDPPIYKAGIDILDQLKDVNVIFGKKGKQTASEKKRTRGGIMKNVDNNEETEIWKKKSILFDLPYWKDNLIRHNLDVMHIEKNVCDNILSTLLNDKQKSKDNLKARLDLKAMRIRKDLWPDANGKCPVAMYTLGKQEITTMLETLKSISFPDGYASNISRCVDLDNRKVFGLKTHDCHILLHDLLPLVIRNVLPITLSCVLVELCACFKQLSARVHSMTELDKLQERIVLAICHLEMIYPPRFFTGQVHLVLHLVEEVKRGGPIQYRWMYPIERFLGKLKSFVRNKARPEVSIAEGWIAEEIFTFTSQYFDDDVSTRWNREKRVAVAPEDPNGESDVIFSVGTPIGDGHTFTLTPMQMLQAHRHVLVNCSIVEPFLHECKEEFKRRMRRRTRDAVDKEVHLKFVDWFRGRITNSARGTHSADLMMLAKGPRWEATRYTVYDINGFRF
ncbi:hypothetical protein LINPERHAP1_LOCUS14199 [Linum perenne]